MRIFFVWPVIGMLLVGCMPANVPNNDSVIPVPPPPRHVVLDERNLSFYCDTAADCGFAYTACHQKECVNSNESIVKPIVCPAMYLPEAKLECQCKENKCVTIVLENSSLARALNNQSS